MSELSGVLAAAYRVEQYCVSQSWKFCFIGGVAVQRWGTPRFTQDVDLTLLAEIGNEAFYIDRFLREFAGRMSDARGFAMNHRVLLAKTAEGIRLDVALGALDFEEATVQRATAWQLPAGVKLTTCSADDLIIHKAFAGRDRDWSDIEGILIRQGERVDVGAVRRGLVPLLEMKEDFSAIDKLDALIVNTRGRRQP